EDFPGNYSDFRSYEDSLPQESSINETKKDKKEWKKDSNNKLSYNEQKEYKNIESKLSSLEYDKKALEAKFHDDSLSPEQIQDLSQKLQEIMDEIEVKELRWFELSSKLEG
ncbi:MAG: ABC transporter C-terminal domain-containing protein, partial [Xanthomarina gelatinilytica]|nr:ABC transporter C-terminal domain-containing protein [Xanthomarina gelatinilytica]